jgi:hypothetical protein
MSAIEKIEQRLLVVEEWGDMPDVRISRREFEAALAEARDAALAAALPEAEVEPYLVEWATEVDDLGTMEIWESEAEARADATRYGQRLFRIEWTEVKA